jgi:alpha-beta hydrolase superfamily lysophospholipase
VVQFRPDDWRSHPIKNRSRRDAMNRWIARSEQGKFMRQRELSSAGIGGLTLRGQAWLPDHDPDAVIAIAHGLAEHSGRYDALAAELTAHDFAVYALDHRGHGRSGGSRANIDRFAHAVSDFCAFAGRAARQHPGAPVYLLGHSMGGAIAFASALRLQESLRGLVLSAPALALGEEASAWRVALARMLSAIAPNVGVLKLAASAVSRDPKVVRDYAADPLVFHGPIPARTVVELLGAMAALPEQAPRMRIPTLIMHGTADSLVPVTATRPVYQAIGSKDRTIKYYEGLYHEVFNEPERAQVMADLLSWLRR